MIIIDAMLFSASMVRCGAIAFSNALSAHPVQPVTRYCRMDAELLLPSRRQLHILPECRLYSRVPGLLVHPRGYLDDAFRAIHAGS